MTLYKIKELEWYRNSIEALSSSTMNGIYNVYDYKNPITAFYNVSTIIGEFKTLEEAKQACQEHWNNLLEQVLEKDERDN